MSALITRALTDRRVNDYCVWTDHRQSERRISPAVGEYAIQEAHRLKRINKNLWWALENLSRWSAVVNDANHAGVKITDDVWSLLYSYTNEARAVLARAERAA